MTISQQYISGDEGYTLLELLVAVAILALLSVPIAGSVKLGLDTWAFTHDTAERQERVLLVQEKVKQLLSQAYPLDTRRTVGVVEYPVDGTATEIEFSAPLLPSTNQNALFRIRLGLNDDALTLSYAPDFAYLGDDVIWQEEVLLEGVSAVDVRYFEGVDASQNPIWLSSWGPTAGELDLPEAISVDVTLDESDLEWVPLTVTTEIEERAFCRFLTSERECLVGASAE